MTTNDLDRSGDAFPLRKHHTSFRADPQVKTSHAKGEHYEKYHKS
jgi:hypothetical protein